MCSITKSKLLAEVVVHPFIPTTQEEKAVRTYEYEANIDYIVRSKLVKDTKRNPVSKKSYYQHA